MIGGYNPWFVEELKRRIEAQALEKAMDLARGAAGDFADYRGAVQFIAGMQFALELAEDIKKEMDR